MKKLFLVFVYALFLHAPAHAQEVELDPRFEDLLESFFQHVSEKDYPSAYALMSETYRASENLKNFKNVLKGIEIERCREKTWTKTKADMYGMLTDISGDFTCPNGTIHHLTFQMFKGDHQISIRDISQVIALTDLQKKIPKASRAKAMALKDLKKILPWLQKGNAHSLYSYLSDQAQGEHFESDVQALTVELKAQHLDLGSPKNLVIDKGFPKLDDDGVLEIQGGYINGSSVIGFSLGYHYQFPSEWHLGGFSFSARK